MHTYAVTVYDELYGGVDVLKVQAKTLDKVIEIVEGNADHEYEIIEIEREDHA